MLPIIYFFVSIFSLFIFILINFYDQNFFESISFKNLSNTNKIKLENPKKINSPNFHFPNFYELKKIQPLLFSISVLILSLSGMLNVWFYCSMLLQRFSVTEFRNNKILISLMFILGIIYNFLILFFFFSPNFLSYLKLDSIKIKEIKLSLTVIIYLSYVFLNIFFAVIGLKSLEMLQKQVEYTDACFSSKLRWKRAILYFCLFMLLIYFCALYIKQKNMKIDEKKIQNVLSKLKIIQKTNIN
jgi:hypothetical protein